MKSFGPPKIKFHAWEKSDILAILPENPPFLLLLLKNELKLPSKVTPSLLPFRSRSMQCEVLNGQRKRVVQIFSKQMFQRNFFYRCPGKRGFLLKNA